MRIYYFLSFTLFILNISLVASDDVQQARNKLFQKLDNTDTILQNIQELNSQDNISHINAITEAWKQYKDEKKANRYTSSSQELGEMRGSIEQTIGLMGIATEMPIHLGTAQSVDPYEEIVRFVLFPLEIIEAISKPAPKNPAPIPEDMRLSAQQYQAAAYMMRNLKNAQLLLDENDIEKIRKEYEQPDSPDPVKTPSRIDISGIEEQYNSAYASVNHLLNYVQQYVHQNVNANSNHIHTFIIYKRNTDHMLTYAMKPYYLNQSHNQAINQTHKVVTMLPQSSFHRALKWRFDSIRGWNDHIHVDTHPPEIPAHAQQRVGLIEWITKGITAQNNSPTELNV